MSTRVTTYCPDCGEVLVGTVATLVTDADAHVIRAVLRADHRRAAHPDPVEKDP